MTAPATVSVQPLAATIGAALTTAGVPFGDGKRPAATGTKPFIVGWFDAGTYGARTLVGGDDWTCVLVAHCAGLTPESSRVAVARLASALYSLHRTTVAGRTVQYPQNLSSQPMTVERDGDRDIYVQAVEWRLRLTP